MKNYQNKKRLYKRDLKIAYPLLEVLQEIKATQGTEALLPHNLSDKLLHKLINSKKWSIKYIIRMYHTSLIMSGETGKINTTDEAWTENTSVLTVLLMIEKDIRAGLVELKERPTVENIFTTYQIFLKPICRYQYGVGYWLKLD